MAIVTTPAGASATFTRYQNQRKTGRLPGGGLLDMIVDGTTVNFFFSKDKGQTWAAVATGSITSVTTASLFTDEVDGFIYLMYVNGGARDLRRGTPTYDGSGQLTAITWTSRDPFPNTITGTWAFPDLFVHKEGAGWKVHVVSGITDGTDRRTKYQRVNVAADGTMTNDITEINLNATSATGQTFPSVCVDLAKNVYVTWTMEATGVGKGVRFRMATYLNGVWTWQTEEAIIESLYADIQRMGPCLVDRSGRVVVALLENSVNRWLRVYRRGVAGGWTDISPVNMHSGTLTMALHTNDDPYIVHVADLGAGLVYRSYAGGQWSDQSFIPTVGGKETDPAACRFTDGFSLDVVVTTGAAAPYTIEHLRVSLATPGGKSRRGYNVITLGRGRRGVWTV